MVLWVDKYRPNSFEDIIGQKESVEKLKAMVKKGDTQHMILSGPPGVGKTASAIVMAKEVFGNVWTQNFMELNASDDRKLSIIQGKVKEFARSRPIDAPFKMILFDEADSLTQEAQQALRRMMEEYSATCRFIFSVNYQSNIIEPLQSRCAILRFQPLSREDIFALIDKLAKNEGLTVDKEAKDALEYVSKGDMRALTNLLQSLSNISKEITGQEVYANAGMIDTSKIKQGLKLAIEGDYIKARQIFETILDTGVNMKELIREIFEILTNTSDLLEPKTKSYAIEKLAEIDYRIVEGATPYIQFQSFLAFLSSLKR